MAMQNPVTISAIVLRETDKAVHVLYEGERMWLPLSQVDVVDVSRGGDYRDVSLPYWLAKKQGITED